MTAITGVSVQLQSIAITDDDELALEFKDGIGGTRNLFISPCCATELLLLLISYIKSDDFTSLLDEQDEEDEENEENEEDEEDEEE